MADEVLDWSKLPDRLRYLIGPAEKYGRLQFDDRIRDYLERRMTPAERAELEALGRRWGENFEAIDAWLDAYAMTVHPEARLVYFTGVFLGTGADTGMLWIP